MADFFYRLSEQIIHPTMPGQAGAVQPLLRPRFAGSAFFQPVGGLLATGPTPQPALGIEGFTPLVPTQPTMAGATPLAMLSLRALATGHAEHLGTPAVPVPATDEDDVDVIQANSAPPAETLATTQTGPIVPTNRSVSLEHAVPASAAQRAAQLAHQVERAPVEPPTASSRVSAAGSAESKPAPAVLPIPAVTAALTAEPAPIVQPKRAATGALANGSDHSATSILAATPSGVGTGPGTPTGGTTPRPAPPQSAAAPIALPSPVTTRAPVWRPTPAPGTEQQADTPTPVTPLPIWASQAASPLPAARLPAAPQGDEHLVSPATPTVEAVPATTGITTVTPILATAVSTSPAPPWPPQALVGTARREFTQHDDGYESFMAGAPLSWRQVQSDQELPAASLRGAQVQALHNTVDAVDKRQQAPQPATAHQGRSPLATPVQPQPALAQAPTAANAAATVPAPAPLLAQPGVVPPWHPAAVTPVTGAVTTPRAVAALAAPPATNGSAPHAESVSMPRPSAPLPRRQSHPSTEPTIRVTIGRVEVRTANPAPPPVRRPAPTALSLDGYLQKTPRRSG